MEATLSIAITSILLLGMGAALSMTMKAADLGTDSNAAACAASEQLSRMNAELSVAVTITQYTGQDLLFTVPDRNGDGSPETIEYTWSGVAGDPLMRSYNGSTPVMVIPNVRTSLISTLVRPAAVPVESAEQILASCDLPTGSSVQSYAIDGNANTSAAQYVRVSLPAGTVSWKLTEVALMLGSNGGGNKTMNVSICTATAALTPTATVLATQSVGTGSLPSSPAWVKFVLGPVPNLDPTQGVCIVVDGGTKAKAIVQYVQGASNPFNTHLMTSSNSPATWSAPNDVKDMRFVLKGTYATMVEP